MNLWRIFREDFSIYEQAAIVSVTYYAFMVFVFVGMIKQNTLVIALGFLALLPIGYILLHRIQCPTCNKSPNIYDTSKWGIFGRFVKNSRLWPEKTCSSCGRDLHKIGI